MIAPIARDRAGGKLNVNADTAAGAMSASATDRSAIFAPVTPPSAIPTASPSANRPAAFPV